MEGNCEGGERPRRMDDIAGCAAVYASSAFPTTLAIARGAYATDIPMDPHRLS
jgi:hypothetical protein